MSTRVTPPWNGPWEDFRFLSRVRTLHGFTAVPSTALDDTVGDDIRVKVIIEARQPTEEEQRRAEATPRRSLKSAIEQGLAAFQAKDYAEVVNALEPFESELDRVAAAKLAYARKKVGSPVRCHLIARSVLASGWCALLRAKDDSAHRCC